MTHQVKDISIQIFFVILFAVLFVVLGNLIPDVCQSIFPFLK